MQIYPCSLTPSEPLSFLTFQKFNLIFFFIGFIASLILFNTFSKSFYNFLLYFCTQLNIMSILS